jgi:gamma-glutamyl hydrolase
MMAILEMPKQKSTNYVKWLESVGITPVCIPYNLPKEDLLICLDKVNGVLWTGGAIENKTHSPQEKKQYTDTLYTSFEVAKKYNDQGRKYPIWGTCQGFEFLVLFHNGKHTSIHSLPKHHADGQFPITFTGNSSMRTWFRPLSEEMKKECSTHHHKYGFDIKPMSHIHILSTQEDYINIIKYKEYPFYGVQFHPERPFDAFSKKVSKQFALFLKSLL